MSLNPAVDVEWRVDSVRWEEKNQVLSERRWPGGKGINVARWLKHLGGSPRLLVPLGGLNGQEIATGLRKMRVRVSRVSLPENTRANVVVTTSKGKQLRFNPLGPELSSAEWRKVLALVRRALRHSRVAIFSGALPRGVSPRAYAQLVKLVNKAVVYPILDCDGAALEHGVKQHPFLVKPNWHELEQWWGKRARSPQALLRAAEAISAETGRWAMVSLGSVGALLVCKPLRERLFCYPPKVRARNTIGAGDAMVAAFALQMRKLSRSQEWLRGSVAAGTAATECAAGDLPDLKRIDEIYKKCVVERL